MFYCMLRGDVDRTWIIAEVVGFEDWQVIATYHERWQAKDHLEKLVAIGYKCFVWSD